MRPFMSFNQTKLNFLLAFMTFIGCTFTPLVDVYGAGPLPQQLQFCGECHMIYPANMLPQRSWQALISKLDNHFGENATVQERDLAFILDYLINNASDSPTIPPRERHFLSEVSPDITTIRITKTRWWNQMHADFDFEGIKNTNVKSAANCPACHIDGVK